MERHVLWLEIARSAGVQPGDAYLELLDRYRAWLAEEALPAGGIGPGEAIRLDDRHIADSLLFSLVIPSDGEVLDVGSGVGLPGIPMAILLSDRRFTLLDRSQKRVDLAKRAVRLLDLGNVEVVRGEVPGFSRRYPVVVSRASLPPESFAHHIPSLLVPGGTAVLGGSWEREPRVEGFVAKEIGSTILDRPVWILIMRQK